MLSFALNGICARVFLPTHFVLQTCIEGTKMESIAGYLRIWALIQCSFCVSTVFALAGVFPGPLKCFWGADLLWDCTTRDASNWQAPLLAGSVGSAQQQVAKTFRAQNYDRFREFCCRLLHRDTGQIHLKLQWYSRPVQLARTPVRRTPVTDVVQRLPSPVYTANQVNQQSEYIHLPASCGFEGVFQRLGRDCVP